MIPTARRAARMSGIALCIKCILVRKHSNAIYDVRRSEKSRAGSPIYWLLSGKAMARTGLRMMPTRALNLVLGDCSSDELSMYPESAPAVLFERHVVVVRGDEGIPVNLGL
jgi:hypothetical protein